MTSHASSDMSLKELILKIQSYIKAITRRWLLICILGFGFAFLLLVFNFNITPEYKADLTYMLNEDESGGLSGIAAMIGQFGLGGGGAESNLDKIIELSRTRRITQTALFEKKKLHNKEDYLANHLISTLENTGHWNKTGILSFLSSEDSLSLSGFRFKQDSIEDFSLHENKALKAVHRAMVGKEMKGNRFQSTFNEITGIMEFSMTTPDPELSILIVNSMFENLSSYYVDKTTEKQQADYRIIKLKYDSIVSELNSVQYRLAKNKDSNQGLFMDADLLPTKKLSEDERRLQLMLGEAEKQKQLTELTLGNSTPYIQIIDKPILPLRPANKSRIFYFLLGGFLGGILAIMIILIQKVYNDIMLD
jgi:uncharacterized protein involved in exopolysaccharide biosynthesis